MDGQALHLAAPELGGIIQQTNDGKTQIKTQALQQPQACFSCPIDQGFAACAFAFVLALALSNSQKSSQKLRGGW